MFSNSSFPDSGANTEKFAVGRLSRFFLVSASICLTRILHGASYGELFSSKFTGAGFITEHTMAGPPNAKHIPLVHASSDSVCPANFYRTCAALDAAATRRCRFVYLHRGRTVATLQSDTNRGGAQHTSIPRLARQLDVCTGRLLGRTRGRTSPPHIFADSFFYMSLHLAGNGYVPNQ